MPLKKAALVGDCHIINVFQAVLDDDEHLTRILHLTGDRQHFYVASVSRRFRGAYMTACRQMRRLKKRDSLWLRTAWRAALTSASRLQLGLANGLNMDYIWMRSPRFTDKTVDLETFWRAVLSTSTDAVEVRNTCMLPGQHQHACMHDYPSELHFPYVGEGDKVPTATEIVIETCTWHC